MKFDQGALRIKEIISEHPYYLNGRFIIETLVKEKKEIGFFGFKTEIIERWEQLTEYTGDKYSWASKYSYYDYRNGGNLKFSKTVAFKTLE